MNAENPKRRDWLTWLAFAILIGWNMWLTATLKAVSELTLQLSKTSHVVIDILDKLTK